MFEIDVRVDYSDTDAMAVVHHGAYCRWLERVRIEWLRSVELDYLTMESQGYSLPLRELKIVYLKPLHFDDQFKVRLWLGQMSRVKVEMNYELRHPSLDLVYTQASTLHVLVRRGDHIGGKPQYSVTSFPQEWRNKWQLLNAKKSSTSH